MSSAQATPAYGCLAAGAAHAWLHRAPRGRPAVPARAASCPRQHRPYPNQPAWPRCLRNPLWLALPFCRLFPRLLAALPRPGCSGVPLSSWQSVSLLGLMSLALPRTHCCLVDCASMHPSNPMSGTHPPALCTSHVLPTVQRQAAALSWHVLRVPPAPRLCLFCLPLTSLHRPGALHGATGNFTNILPLALPPPDPCSWKQIAPAAPADYSPPRPPHPPYPPPSPPKPPRPSPPPSPPPLPSPPLQPPSPPA